MTVRWSVFRNLVNGNRFHRPHIYHPYSVDPRSAVVEWIGNTLDGAPLSL